MANALTVPAFSNWLNAQSKMDLEITPELVREYIADAYNGIGNISYENISPMIVNDLLTEIKESMNETVLDEIDKTLNDAK